MSALTRAMYAKRGLPLASAEKPVVQSDWEMKLAAGGGRGGGPLLRPCRPRRAPRENGDQQSERRLDIRIQTVV
jgi:hypothetical protein